MRIIKKGCSEVRASCSHCGAVFAYYLDELRTNYRFGGQYVNCPHCGEQYKHRPVL